jgi:hypothetical protein
MERSSRPPRNIRLAGLSVVVVLAALLVVSVFVTFFRNSSLPVNVPAGYTVVVFETSIKNGQLFERDGVWPSRPHGPEVTGTLPVLDTAPPLGKNGYVVATVQIPASDIASARICRSVQSCAPVRVFANPVWCNLRPRETSCETLFVPPGTYAIMALRQHSTKAAVPRLFTATQIAEFMGLVRPTDWRNLGYINTDKG